MSDNGHRRGWGPQNRDPKWNPNQGAPPGTIDQSRHSKPLVGEMPERERPISQLYLELGKRWAKAKKEAYFLDLRKKPFLASLKAKIILAHGGDMADNKAERMAMETEEWNTYLKGLAEAQFQEDDLKVELDAMKMRYNEWNDASANARVERRFG
jgi:hypothetical protein